MTKGIFITGTGTDVGKTYISGLLVKQLINNKIDCTYYKPVLSGGYLINNELIAGDVQHVLKTANITTTQENHVSYIFKNAVSPHLASKQENTKIILDKIINDYNNISKKHTLTVVEGAGGIICPLNLEKNLFIYNIPQALNLDCIIVADASLGTINTTFLTVDFMKRNKLNIKGIILNNFDTTNIMHTDNLKTIEQICDIKVIGTVEKNGIEINFTTGAFKKLYE